MFFNIISIISLFVGLYLAYKCDEYEKIAKSYMIKYDNQVAITQEIESKKKSTEVRTGQLIEKWIPYSNEFDINPQNARFIGDPIDFVVFDEDKITFIEVKTGSSSLSKKQRNIRNLIQDGKIEFKELRIK